MYKEVKLRGTDSARVIRVIETEALAGSGTKDDPYCILKQYWDLDGNLLAKSDLNDETQEVRG